MKKENNLFLVNKQLKNKNKTENYPLLINNLGKLIEEGRFKAYRSINNILVETYWNIGKYIVEYEQQGNIRAEYGENLLYQISRDLKLKYGRGFSYSNLYNVRQFYIIFPIFQTVSGKLTWSHILELLYIDSPLERSFYEKQCVIENWSVRELRRQMDSMLFHRIALNKNPKEILELSKKGQIIQKPKDLIKDEYILEFLDIKNKNHSEKELENSIVSNLRKFILELGKGFSFIGQQYKINIGKRHYYIDLVFYNYNLKCFCLIDLKNKEINYSDIGQMNMYLNYFKYEENKKEDNDPIGIILSREKNDVCLKYALGGITNKLFTAKYKLYLPNKEELEEKLRELLF
ncbi:MAG: PDDEXK nuclease domain-containing protein [archaeon]